MVNLFTTSADPKLLQGDIRRFLEFGFDNLGILGTTAIVYLSYLAPLLILGSIVWLIGWVSMRRNVLSFSDMVLATIPFILWLITIFLVPLQKTIVNILELPLLSLLATLSIAPRLWRNDSDKVSMARFGAFCTAVGAIGVWVALPSLPIAWFQ